MKKGALNTCHFGNPYYDGAFACPLSVLKQLLKSSEIRDGALSWKTCNSENSQSFPRNRNGIAARCPQNQTRQRNEPSPTSMSQVQRSENPRSRPFWRLTELTTSRHQRRLQILVLWLQNIMVKSQSTATNSWQRHRKTNLYDPWQTNSVLCAPCPVIPMLTRFVFTGIT